jgi:hypothetical protein
MPFRKNKSVVGREDFGSLIGLAFEDEGGFLPIPLYGMGPPLALPCRFV